MLGILCTWLLSILLQVAGIYQPNPELGMYSVLPDFSSGFGIPSLKPTLMQMDFLWFAWLELHYGHAVFPVCRPV